MDVTRGCSGGTRSASSPPCGACRPGRSSDGALLALALVARAAAWATSAWTSTRRDPGGGGPGRCRRPGPARPARPVGLAGRTRSSPLVARDGTVPDPPAAPAAAHGVDAGASTCSGTGAFEVDVDRELVTTGAAGRDHSRGRRRRGGAGHGLRWGARDRRTRSPDLQFVAARRALVSPVSVIAGGPGTGKTHTVAGILAAAHLTRRRARRGVPCRPRRPDRQGGGPHAEAVEHQVRTLVAEARVGAAPAGILAAKPDHDPQPARLQTRGPRVPPRPGQPAPHDLVIIDETSMVSLPLLARLLDAVRPKARLVLVGDPFQLASIEAGTVMGDLVGRRRPGPARADGPLHGRVTELVRGRRFAPDSRRPRWRWPSADGDADAVVESSVRGSPGSTGCDPTTRPPWPRCAPRCVDGRDRRGHGGPGRATGRRPWPRPPGSRSWPPCAGVPTACSSGATSIGTAVQAASRSVSGAGGRGWACRSWSPGTTRSTIWPTATWEWWSSPTTADGWSWRAPTDPSTRPGPTGGVGAVVGDDHPQEPGLRVLPRRGGAPDGATRRS